MRHTAIILLPSIFLLPDIKKLCLTTTLCLCSLFFSTKANGQSLAWAKAMGGSTDDAGQAVAVDATGNVYVTGWFEGTADFDPGAAVTNLTSNGQFDLFITKLDASGNLIWAKSIGGTAWERGYSIAVDPSGNVFTTGYFRSAADFDPGAGVYTLTPVGYGDIFALKLDASGNFVWAKSIGSTSYDQGYSIAADASGNAYITGYFEGTADFDPGPSIFNLTSAGSQDVFISKLDVSGNLVWAKRMGGTSNDQAFSLAVDISGNVYTTGTFRLTVDFDPGATVSNLISAGTDEDIFVSKLDNSGNFVWARAMGGSDADMSESIALDAAGNIYTTGYFINTADFDPGLGTYSLTSSGGSEDAFVSKLDASGNFVWAKAMTGASDEGGHCVAVDGAGNVYTIGNFTGITDFNPGASVFTLNSGGWDYIYISKLDMSGNFIWAYAFGDSDSYGNSITLDASSNVYTAGAFRGTVDFDPAVSTVNLISNGPFYDAFMQKLSQCTSAPSQPAAIVGSIAACSGSSQTYSVPAVMGASSYTWTLPSGWTGTSTTNSITAIAGVTGGNITVVAVNSCGTSASQTLAVAVSPGPSATITATGATTFCQGGSVMLNANTGTGLSYQWKLNGTNITGAATASYTANASGSYTVVVTSTSCSSTSAATTVTVNLLPTATITQAGNVLTAPAGFASYKWYKNAILIPGATTSTYTATSSGSYYLIVTNANNCSGQSNTIGLTVGINDMSVSSVQLYPNPGDGRFHLDISAVRNTPGVKVFDILGKEVTAEVKRITAAKLCVEISNKLPGTYYVQLIFPGEVINMSVQIK
jgi:hypothetical protein